MIVEVIYIYTAKCNGTVQLTASSFKMSSKVEEENKLLRNRRTVV